MRNSKLATGCDGWRHKFRHMRGSCVHMHEGIGGFRRRRWLLVTTAIVSLRGTSRYSRGTSPGNSNKHLVNRILYKHDKGSQQGKLSSALAGCFATLRATARLAIQQPNSLSLISAGNSPSNEILTLPSFVSRNNCSFLIHQPRFDYFNELEISLPFPFFQRAKKVCRTCEDILI